MRRLQGCLLPPFHSAYWFGLQSEGDPKDTNSWSWLNRSPKPSPETYTHWGTYKPGGQLKPFWRLLGGRATRCLPPGLGIALQMLNLSALVAAGGEMEPNNKFGGEVCGACNYTEAFSGVWGWADSQCGRNLSFICEQDREWPIYGPYTNSPAGGSSCFP